MLRQLAQGRLCRPLAVSRRFNSSFSGTDYYKLFPQTFPNGSPPKADFNVDLKRLRKEYRLLQSANHPDLSSLSAQADANNNQGELSSLINKAYSTLSNPLTRSQYLLQKNAQIDLSKDDVNKRFQFQDQALLMQILDIHEDLEDIQSENDLDKLEKENDSRIEDTISVLSELYKQENYDKIALETVKLKYWYNIKNALKEWEAGKPVNLTH